MERATIAAAVRAMHETCPDEPLGHLIYTPELKGSNLFGRMGTPLAGATADWLAEHGENATIETLCDFIASGDIEAQMAWREPLAAKAKAWLIEHAHEDHSMEDFANVVAGDCTDRRLVHVGMSLLNAYPEDAKDPWHYGQAIRCIRYGFDDERWCPPVKSVSIPRPRTPEDDWYDNNGGVSYLRALATKVTDPEAELDEVERDLVSKVLRDLADGIPKQARPMDRWY